MAKTKTTVTRELLEQHLSPCMNKAMWSCEKDPTLIFSGCPETTQLAWRVSDVLGLGLEAVIMQGKGKTWEDERWVDHLWVDLPNLGLRIETNASQILGIPTFVEVTDISEFEDRYRDEFENMEFLDRVTEAGNKFYYAMAEKIVKCLRTRAKRRE